MCFPPRLVLFSPTYGQLWQGAAQLLSDVSELLQLGLLLPPVLAGYLLTQPLVRLQPVTTERRGKQSDNGSGNAWWIYYVLTQTLIMKYS